MATISHELSEALPARQAPPSRAPVRDMWASLAIAVMSLAVAFDAMLGPEIVSSTPGGSTTSIPSAVLVAFFAYLGTRVVARYGFCPARNRAD